MWIGGSAIMVGVKSALMVLGRVDPVTPEIRNNQLLRNVDTGG